MGTRMKSGFSLRENFLPGIQSGIMNFRFIISFMLLLTTCSFGLSNFVSSKFMPVPAKRKTYEHAVVYAKSEFHFQRSLLTGRLLLSTEKVVFTPTGLIIPARGNTPGSSSTTKELKPGKGELLTYTSGVRQSGLWVKINLANEGEIGGKIHQLLKYSNYNGQVLNSYTRRKLKVRFYSLSNSMFHGDNSSHSPGEKDSKILISGIAGSVLFGLMGAIIGYASSLDCHRGDTINSCSAKGDNSFKGAAIGATAGSVFGFTAHIGENKKKKPFLRIMIGSVAGGIAGYYMSHRIPFGLSSFLLPPLAANIAIHL